MSACIREWSWSWMFSSPHLRPKTLPFSSKKTDVDSKLPLPFIDVTQHLPSRHHGATTVHVSLDCCLFPSRHSWKYHQFVIEVTWALLTGGDLNSEWARGELTWQISIQSKFFLHLLFTLNVFFMFSQPLLSTQTLIFECKRLLLWSGCVIEKGREDAFSLIK